MAMRRLTGFERAGVITGGILGWLVFGALGDNVGAAWIWIPGALVGILAGYLVARWWELLRGR